MKILHESQIDISGFASVRERVLLHSREFFRHQPEPETFGQFGSLLYLANAWFTSHGSTKLHHHHEGVDIVSVIPRGEMHHEGTIGDGEVVAGNTVQIQRCGEQGFSHNEINPTDQPQPFIQMWFQPDQIDEQASFELVDIAEQGETPVYQSSETRLSVLSAQADWQWQSEHECLLFVYAGSAVVREGNESVEVERGHLIQALQPIVQAQAGLKAIAIQLAK